MFPVGGDSFCGISMPMHTLSAIDSFGRAWDGMVTRLFKPFRMGKWFALGFTAWLAGLMDSSSGGFSIPGNRDLETLRTVDFDFAAFWHEHGQMLILGGIAVAVVIIALSILFLWLSSRGKFMFLRNAIDDTALISPHWHAYGREASSLFRWQLGFMALTLIAFAVIAAAAALLLWPAIQRHEWTAPAIALTAVLVFVTVTLFIVTSVIHLFLNDFIVPVMLKHGLRTNEAWSYCRPAMSRHIPQLILYILFRMVIVIGIGFAVLLGIIVTCCCLGALLVIPYVGAVAMLPASLLLRLYSVEYMRGFGADFDLTPAVPDHLPEALPANGNSDSIPSPS